jgi:hypothetical protein
VFAIPRKGAKTQSHAKSPAQYLEGLYYKKRIYVENQDNVAKPIYLSCARRTLLEAAQGSLRFFAPLRLCVESRILAASEPLFIFFLKSFSVNE